MRKIGVLSIIFLLLGSNTAANATTLSFTVEVWHDNSIVGFDYDEAIPSLTVIKNQLLKNCKSEMVDIGLGSKAKAVNQSGATAGLGKVTGVALGKIYKGFGPSWGNEENADPQSWLSKFSKYFDYDDDNPTNVETIYVAPCIFKGSINNLRTSSFYRFYFGDYRTEEYDLNDLKKKKWRLSFFDNDLTCSNYYELNNLTGCND